MRRIVLWPILGAGISGTVAWLTLPILSDLPGGFVAALEWWVRIFGVIAGAALGGLAGSAVERLSRRLAGVLILALGGLGAVVGFRLGAAVGGGGLVGWLASGILFGALAGWCAAWLSLIAAQDSD